MKINILIKHNLNKIYNILEKCKNNRFLSKYSKSIEVYNDKNQLDIFKKSLKNNNEKLFIIDDNGYIPFLYFSKQKGISVAFPTNADGATLARAHNDSRVCVIALNNTTVDSLESIFKAYLTTKFEGGRHATRISIMHNSFNKAKGSIKFNNKSKTIVLCADHAGYRIKEIIKDYLIKSGYMVVDVGTQTPASTHYSMFAISAALHANNSFAIVAVCYTGAGIANTLNKFKGINACICSNSKQAKLAREKIGANALSIAAKYIKKQNISKTIDSFLKTKPTKVNPTIAKLGFSFDKSRFNKIKISKEVKIPTGLK